MADLARIHDLTADGDSIQEDPIGVWLELTRGIDELPAVRGADQLVPRSAGRIPRARVADHLSLELEGVVLGVPDFPDDPDGSISYRTKMLALRTLFDRTKEPWVLSGVLEDGSTATINVRTVEYVPITKVAGLASELKVALESVDPDWAITPP